METPSPKFENLIIVGTQRSGTTLLQKLISERFCLATPFESLFIPVFDRFKFLWGDLSKPKNRKQLLEAIFLYLEARYSSADELPRKVKENHSLLICKIKTQEIVEESKSYSDIIQLLFTYYATLKEMPGYVEKTAYHNWPPLPRLGEIFENALFVHIIRNPVDTYSSWTKTWFGPRYPGTAANIWNTINRSCSRWGNQNPDRYVLVKYEDLINTPEKELARLSEKLTNKIQTLKAAQKDESLFQSISEKSWFKNINKNVGGADTDKREGIESKDLSVINISTRNDAEKYNYTTSRLTGVSFRHRSVALSHRVLENFTPNALKRQIEKNFPIFARVLQLTKTDRIFLTCVCTNSASGKGR